MGTSFLHYKKANLGLALSVILFLNLLPFASRAELSVGTYPTLLCELTLAGGAPGDKITDPSLVQKLTEFFEGFRYVGEKFYRGNSGGVIALMNDRNFEQNIAIKPSMYEAALEVVMEGYPQTYLGYGIAAAMGSYQYNVFESQNVMRTRTFLADERELNGFFEYLGARLGDTTLFPIRYRSVVGEVSPKEHLQLFAVHGEHPVASSGYLKIHDLSAHWAINFITKYAIERSQAQIKLLLNFSDWIKHQPEAQYWNENAVMYHESLRIDFSSYNWVPAAVHDRSNADIRYVYKNLNDFVADGVSPKDFLRGVITKPKHRGTNVQSRVHLLMALNRYFVTHNIQGNEPKLDAETMWQHMEDMRARLQKLDHEIFLERALPWMKYPK